MSHEVDSSNVEKRVNEYIDLLETETSSGFRFGKLLVSDVFNFDDFNTSVWVPDSGEYIFSVEQKYLKEAMRLINVSAHTNSHYIEVQVFRNKMKLAIFNQTIFSEIFIPLVEDCLIENTGSKNIYFFIERDVLNKIASRFKDSEIEFVFRSETGVISVNSGNTSLELGVPVKGYTKVNYHAKLKELKHINKVNTNLLKDAVKYVSYFVKKNDMKKYLSQADLKAPMLYGGSFDAVGIYASKEFNKFNCNMKYESLGFLTKILSYFNPENTHLFESDNYYVLRDENLYFGFEKSNYTFPSIKKFIEVNFVKDKLLISRKKLLDSLHKLSIVLSRDKALIKLKVGLVGNVNYLKLIIKDAGGKTSTDSFEIIRETEDEKIKDFGLEFIISFNTFVEVLSHFNSELVTLEYIKNKVLVVKDRGDNYEVFSNFSLFSESCLNKL